MLNKREKFLVKEYAKKLVGKRLNEEPRPKKITKADLEDVLLVAEVGKLKNGNFIARRGFFYSDQAGEEKLKKEILKRFPDANIINTGKVYRPFKGGATTKNSSHYWVEFNFSQPN